MLKQVPFRKTLRTKCKKNRNNGLGKWQCSDLGKWMGAINFRGIATKYFFSSSFLPQNFTGSSSKACNTNISDFKGPRSSSSSLRKINSLEVKIENRSMTRIRRPNGLSPWSSCAAAAASPAQRDPFPFIPQRKHPRFLHEKFEFSGPSRFPNLLPIKISARIQSAKRKEIWDSSGRLTKWKCMRRMG